MREISANALLADEFPEHFDGCSIGANDFTQLTLGVDRDSSFISGMLEMEQQKMQVGLRRGLPNPNSSGRTAGFAPLTTTNPR